MERHLQLARNVGASRNSYFLRAETMHGLYSYLEDNPSTRRKDPEFHTMSHGELFLELMVDRFREDGPWVLDEPGSALSFSGSLALVGILTDLIAEGNSQIVMSTHPPLLVSLPGAGIYEVGPWGLRASDWECLDLVTNWRSFMNMPRRYLRHLKKRGAGHLALHPRKSNRRLLLGIVLGPVRVEVGRQRPAFTLPLGELLLAHHPFVGVGCQVVLKLFIFSVRCVCTHVAHAIAFRRVSTASVSDRACPRGQTGQDFSPSSPFAI